jgi:tyrosinase
MFALQLTIAALAFAIFGSSYSVQVLPDMRMRPTQNNTFTKTVETGGDNLASRKEIRVLQDDEDLWNIYLLGLSRLKDVDGDDPMSFYQIAAIHGQPYVQWDNNSRCDDCTPAGCCTHRSILFPTWHRAYLSLFEQALVNNALIVAEQFTGYDRERYTLAARRLRIPYWDWAQLPADGEHAFPQLFTYRDVFVNSPNGPMNISNPLRSYNFRASEEHEFIGGDETVRQPTFTVSGLQLLRSDLWTTLSSNQSYNSFSAEVLNDSDVNLNPISLEAIHDKVHVLIGGHMAIVSQAAYDPIFWLHHANVDRLFAIYQEAYPEKWVAGSVEVGSSMWYNAGTKHDSTSSLQPFHSNFEGGFWTSDDLRDIGNLSYFYEDLRRYGAVPIINSLFGKLNHSVEDREESAGNLAKRSREITDIDDSFPDFVDPTVRNGITTEYLVKIEAEAKELDGSVTVFIFDGDFNSDDPSDWHCEENLVGSHGFFAPRAPTASDFKVRAGISLTNALYFRTLQGFLSDMDSDSVRSYLKQKLEWRVLDAEGCIKEPGEVSGFKVTVIESEVEIFTNYTHLPVWGSFKTVYQAGVRDEEGCI